MYTFWWRHADQHRFGTSDPEIYFEIPDSGSRVSTIYVSNCKLSIRQYVLKSPVVSNKTLVPTAVTKMPTLNERRYPQRERERRTHRNLICKEYTDNTVWIIIISMFLLFICFCITLQVLKELLIPLVIFMLFK